MKFCFIREDVFPKGVIYIIDKKGTKRFVKSFCFILNKFILVKCEDKRLVDFKNIKEIYSQHEGYGEMIWHNQRYPDD